MKKITRRHFLTYSATALGSVPLVALTSGSLRAADMPHLDPSDPQAKALSYTDPSPRAESHCANCQLYSGASGAEWGPCAIFPGKQVSAAAWCSAWVKKAG